jgi:FAH family protein
VRPDGCEDLHYEGELAIIIGRICKQVPEERVADVVFGYTIANDVTARDWQREGDQWFRAKGSDTFCPLGPWINTHFTLAEAGHLAIETRLGDEVLQRGNTAQMVRGISDLVTYISSFTTLLPGDVILTGTPAGVGPMADGDVVSVEIDGLGVLSNPVTSA